MAKVRPLTRCTTARSSAGKTPSACTCIRAGSRRTSSFASIRQIGRGIAATIACTKNSTPWAWRIPADLTTAAGGHSWTYFNFVAERVLKFLVAGLEQESRRLL